jgi:hypothetical protein
LKQNPKDERKVEMIVTRWLTTQYTDLYQREIGNLDPQNDKFLSCGGDYVEKQWDSRKIKSKLFLSKNIKNINLTPIFSFLLI